MRGGKGIWGVQEDLTGAWIDGPILREERGEMDSRPGHVYTYIHRAEAHQVLSITALSGLGYRAASGREGWLRHRASWDHGAKGGPGGKSQDPVGEKLALPDQGIRVEPSKGWS